VSVAHWPWWLGAAGLAGVTVGSCVVGRRPFGVSGILGRLVNWRAERSAERSRAQMASADDAALEAALAAATAEAFADLRPAFEAAGAENLPPSAPLAAEAVLPAGHGEAGASCQVGAASIERPSIGAHTVFLVAIVAGAALASALRGGFHPTLALPEAYARLVAGGGWGYLGLVAGGLLVGVGTTVSGGCSTGHGLTGCARLQPAGVAASATYVGVAVAVSLLLGWRLG
jgi:uncharacterized membrane protein YedE/YeeE